MTAIERLFDATQAFAHPVTVVAVTAIGIGLVAASVVVRVLYRAHRLSPKTYQELIARTRSWYLLAVAMVVPILLGAAWVCGSLLLLSLFCFREFARATRLPATPTTIVPILAAILLTYFAVLDHWMGLFTTSWAVGTCLIAVSALLPDRPQGYLHRVSLSIVAFALFGISLGHLAFISNDAQFRPILLWLLLSVELNDVFAYLMGKAFGKRKMLPNTSPNKTWMGAVGAVVLTSSMSAWMGHYVFAGSALDNFYHLLLLGLQISLFGQCGDLVISSIKRDVGLKDMSSVIPGHGGLLDRFDSLLIVAPLVFHYINYFQEHGIGGDQPVRILTGG